MCDHLSLSNQLPQATANPNTKIFPVKALQPTAVTSSKRPPPECDRDHFLGLTVKDFPLFLTSRKRPLDAFSDLRVRFVHYAT